MSRKCDCYLNLVEEKGSFANYLWDFVDRKPKDMKRRGFSFFGTTICYAHLQAMGMVNDHLLQCPRHRACAAMAG